MLLKYSINFFLSVGTLQNFFVKNLFQPSTSKMNFSENSDQLGGYPEAAAHKLRQWLFQNLMVLKKLLIACFLLLYL